MLPMARPCTRTNSALSVVSLVVFLTFLLILIPQVAYQKIDRYHGLDCPNIKMEMDQYLGGGTMTVLGVLYFNTQAFVATFRGTTFS